MNATSRQIATDYHPGIHAATTQARNALYRAGRDAFAQGAAPQDMVTPEMQRGYRAAMRDYAYAEGNAYLVKRGEVQ